MPDFLLVHGAAQGAWSWGKVWGHMTAPEDHPPRLYGPRQATRVRALDLPGHGADAGFDVAVVDFAESVRTITNIVEREKFTDYVLVGHELGGTLALQAAAESSAPPKHIILLAGVVPRYGGSIVSAYPLPARAMIRMCKTLGAVLGRDFTLPLSAMKRYWCRDLDPMLQNQAIGHLGRMPLRMLTQPISLDLNQIQCPVTYVVLTDNRLISPARQRAMAGRLPDATIVELDAGHQAVVQKPRELAEMLLATA